ncbi:hypothetical protein [Spirosoma sp.]|uniref:hypothetical protein n=1 Tax=Spirosoma sp. TaxID=1899569 RepID=UPI003B3A763A
MAQASTSDFTDDIKNQLKAILVGSFAYGSVFPLILRTFSAVIPTTPSTQSVIFHVVNIIYFIIPLLIGAIVWLFLKKNDANDLLFKTEGLSLFNIDSGQKWTIKHAPAIVLVLLVVTGCAVIVSSHHGPNLIWVLFATYLLITGGALACCLYLYRKLKLPYLSKSHKSYFKQAATRIWLQAGIGVLLSSVLFGISTTFFFRQHEKVDFWKADTQEDSTLSIKMPFQWEETSKRIDSSLVKPINGCFTEVSNEANVLTATMTDYNDITIRISPAPKQQEILNKTLPLKAADSLRNQLITAYLLTKKLLKAYSGTDSLDTLLQKINASGQVQELEQCYSLSLDSIRQKKPHADALFTPTMQLFRANQLMPLADNLSEAADILRLQADERSRFFLAEWVNINRIKGFFFLSIFLNLLLFAWLIIRLTNEVLIRNPKAQPSTDSPKQYRELISLRYFITIVLLLIIPLFRTIDASTVNASHPYWFLNLPELVNNVVQPLPNTAANANYGQNEVTSRLDLIDQKVKSLSEAAKKLEKVSTNTRSDLHDMKY